MPLKQISMRVHPIRVIPVAHYGRTLGGSRVEGIEIFLIQIQSNSLGDYKNLFKE